MEWLYNALVTGIRIRNEHSTKTWQFLLDNIEIFKKNAEYPKLISEFENKLPHPPPKKKTPSLLLLNQEAATIVHRSYLLGEDWTGEERSKKDMKLHGYLFLLWHFWFFSSFRVTTID